MPQTFPPSKPVSINKVGYPSDTSIVWDDLRFPFFGRRLDRTSGHLDYDLAELGVNFDYTSRYNDLDMIGIIAQLPHNKKLGSNLRPHAHWIQNQDECPNMLMKYRIYDNGEAPPPTWIEVAYDSLVYAYVSGSILQIVKFPEIDMSSEVAVSSFVDIKLFRDTANTSGKFAGADPYTGDALMKEFDFHYEINQMGSRQEYIK